MKVMILSAWMLVFYFVLTTAVNHNNAYYDDTPNELTKCDLCKEIVSLIYEDVKMHNQTYHDLVNLIKDLCKMIGGPLVAKECDFILHELTIIEELIVSGYNVTTICDKIHMCTKFI